jgi:hypothetical protein
MVRQSDLGISGDRLGLTGHREEQRCVALGGHGLGHHAPSGVVDVVGSVGDTIKRLLERALACSGEELHGHRALATLGVEPVVRAGLAPQWFERNTHLGESLQVGVDPHLDVEIALLIPVPRGAAADDPEPAKVNGIGQHGLDVGDGHLTQHVPGLGAHIEAIEDTRVERVVRFSDEPGEACLEDAHHPLVGLEGEVTGRFQAVRRKQ